MSALKLVGFILGAGAVGGIAMVGLSMIGNVASTASSVATAPGRVIQKTMETNNIIAKYEYFHDAYAVYKSRVAQIREFKQILAETKDEAEKSRVRIELSAQKSSCRDIANQYNANSTKTNQSIFKGQEAPTLLDMTACE